jgi:hypothetical protein
MLWNLHVKVTYRSPSWESWFLYPMFSLVQPQCLHFGNTAMSSAKLRQCSSAKFDNIFWNKFEETLFRWLIETTLLQIFSHPHHRLSENMCRWCHLKTLGRWCRLLKSSVEWVELFRRCFRHIVLASRWPWLHSVLSISGVRHNGILGNFLLRTHMYDYWSERQNLLHGALEAWLGVVEKNILDV